MRNSVRVIVTSVNSIGQQPGGVVDGERRPRPGRAPAASAVPAKMTSSIFGERTVRGPWAPSTQATASTTLDLPLPFGPDHDGDARLELEGGGVGEGLEALEGERLQEHVGASTLAPAPRGPTVGRSHDRRVASDLAAARQKKVERPLAFTRTIGRRQRRHGLALAVVDLVVAPGSSPAPPNRSRYCSSASDEPRGA